jgi:hypothetical protein
MISINDIFIFNNDFSDPNNQMLSVLNENLSKSMFLDTRSSISLADFYCFSQVLQHFSELDNYSKSQTPNVYRWILQIQNMEGMQDVLNQLNFTSLDELPFGLQPPKPKGGGKKQQKKKQPKQKKQKKKKQKKNKNTQPPKEQVQTEKKSNEQPQETTEKKPEVKPEA